MNKKVMAVAVAGVLAAPAALAQTSNVQLYGRANLGFDRFKGEANAAFVDRGVPTTLLYTSFYWDNLVHFGMQPQRGADGTLGFVLPMDGAKLPGIAAASRLMNFGFVNR